MDKSASLTDARKAGVPMTPEELAAAVTDPAPARRRKIWKVAAPVLLVVLAAGGWGIWRMVRAGNQAPTYVTESLHRGTIQLGIIATGNLVPITEVTVGSELSGTTLEVYVDINDRVVTGQPLAKLDTSKLAQLTEASRAAVRSAEAKVVQAEATVVESDAELARQRALYGIQVSSTADLETAVALSTRSRADVKSALALVGEAQAQVRIHEYDLSKAVIQSPIDGIVLTRSLEPGQTVAASFTAPQLFLIAEKLERLKLEVSIAEADIGRVAKGQKSSFTVDAWPERSYQARVSRVAFGSVVKDNVVTYLAELEVDNDDLSLRPGMTATTDIRVAERTNVFLVPAAALRFDAESTNSVASRPKKSFVQSLIPMPTRNSSRPVPEEAGEEVPAPGARIWVLREGRAEAVPVTSGLSDGRHTEISGEGLSAGLLVILRQVVPPA